MGNSAIHMVDCTHDGLGGSLQAIEHADYVATYVTGSAGIRWTAADYQKIPSGKRVITIDQGGPGTPVMNAIVRDVERGAWTVQEAVKIEGWNPPNGRRTIYCSVDTLQDLIALNWKGDVWVAAPSPDFPVPYNHPGLHIVAQQYLFSQNAGAYDVSMILDGNWPGAHADPIHASVTVIHRVADIAFDAVVDPSPADHYVIKYGDTVLDRVPARQPSETVIHVTGMDVPGSNGGEITISPIVHGQPTRAVTVKLP